MGKGAPYEVARQASADPAKATKLTQAHFISVTDSCGFRNNSKSSWSNND